MERRGTPVTSLIADGVAESGPDSGVRRFPVRRRAAQVRVPDPGRVLPRQGRPRLRLG